MEATRISRSEAGSAPNLTMTLGNYQVFGDIDRMYVQLAPGSTRLEFFYQITCVAQNLATGITRSSWGSIRLPLRRLFLSAEARPGLCR